MSNDPEAIPPPHERALKHCDDYIAWYERVKTSARRFDYGLQCAIIAFSAATPLLILMETLPAVLKALPATIAAIAAGLQGTFKYRERYLGFAMAGELLKAERLRFQLRVLGLAPGDPRYSTEVERFASRVNKIVLTETGEWRRHLSLQPTPGQREEGRSE